MNVGVEWMNDRGGQHRRWCRLAHLSFEPKVLLVLHTSTVVCVLQRKMMMRMMIMITRSSRHFWKRAALATCRHQQLAPLLETSSSRHYIHTIHRIPANSRPAEPRTTVIVPHSSHDLQGTLLEPIPLMNPSLRKEIAHQST